MRKHSKLGIGIVAAFVVAAVVLVALMGRGSTSLPSAIYRGYLSADRTNLTFIVSNPTPAIIVVEFGAIESLAGTNWRLCPLWTDKPRTLSVPDAPLTVLPNTAAQKQVTVTALLEPSSWRLHAVEAKPVAGPERYYVELAWHFKSKVPLTTNLFAEGGTWLGHHKALIVNETGALSE